MSELTTLARPYASAVFKRAKETGSVEAWSDALRFLSALMSDQRLEAAASNPRLRKEQFTSAFLDMCGDHLSAEAKNFVRLLIENRRLNLSGDISALFEQLKADEEGYVDVAVLSAYEMSSAEEKKLVTTLEKFLDKKPKLKVAVDPELIGGVYIKAGDCVIDASVRGQIERLATTLCN